MARRTKKTDEEAGSEAEGALLPFVTRYASGLQNYVLDFEADIAVWVEQRTLMKDPAEIALCDELLASYRGLLGLDGAPPSSLKALMAIASRIPTTFEMRRQPPRVGVKPPPSPAPRNAWLIMGNETSWLDREQVDGINVDPEYWLWDGSPHTEAHDLVFIYYTAPHSAIHFVARAACDPFYDTSIRPRAEIARGQWWFGMKSLVEVEPITFKELCEVCGETLNLKGQSGKMLSAAAANKLLARMKVRYPTDAATRDDLVQPVADHTRPSPAQIGVDELRALVPGTFALEREVEDFIVDPLLRLAGLHAEPHRIERQVRVGRGLADRVVYRDAKPTCVIEVKRRMHLDRTRDWSNCADVTQASGYASRLGTRFMLIDVDLVACFEAGAEVPSLVLDRRELTADGIARIRSHAM
jgi:hypothetical protein